MLDTYIIQQQKISLIYCLKLLAKNALNIIYMHNYIMTTDFKLL